jgi:prefoldin subunit 5
MSEQIIQLGDGLNDLRQDTAALQQQVDSLRLVVAKQDTVIRQLANLAGVPISR